MPGGETPTLLAAAMATMLLTGQRPGWTRAHRAMAGFRLREHQLVGCRVTLRNRAMWRFVHRFLEMSLVRGRGFVGISAMDTHGGWSMGCQDLLMFPELEHIWNMVPGVGGLDMHMCSTATDTTMAMCLWSCYLPVQTT